MKGYADIFEAKIAPLGWSPDPAGSHRISPWLGQETVVLAGGWEGTAAVPACDFFVEECVLFQSILGRGGAEYVPLARIAFGKERE